MRIPFSFLFFLFSFKLFCFYFVYPGCVCVFFLFVVCSNCKFKRVESARNWNEMKKRLCAYGKVGFWIDLHSLKEIE